MADETEKVSYPLGGVGGKAPTYGQADRKGFVGVSPEYANYANDTDKPLEATDSEDEEPEPEPEPEPPARQSSQQAVPTTQTSQVAQPANPVTS